MLLSACQEKKNEALQKSMPPQSNSDQVGADRDSNGCISSAGYLFSIVKNRCIRPWEEGTRFEEYPSENTGYSPKAIFVILSDDKQKAEILWGGTDRPSILIKKQVIEGDVEPIYYESKIDQLSIQYRKGAYWIMEKGKVIYCNYESEKDGFNAKL
jgi:hypothetical protein